MREILLPEAKKTTIENFIQVHPMWYLFGMSFLTLCTYGALLTESEIISELDKEMGHWFGGKEGLVQMADLFNFWQTNSWGPDLQAAFNHAFEHLNTGQIVGYTIVGTLSSFLLLVLSLGLVYFTYKGLLAASNHRSNGYIAIPENLSHREDLVPKHRENPVPEKTNDTTSVQDTEQKDEKLSHKSNSNSSPTEIVKEPTDNHLEKNPFPSPTILNTAIRYLGYDIEGNIEECKISALNNLCKKYGIQFNSFQTFMLEKAESLKKQGKLDSKPSIEMRDPIITVKLAQTLFLIKNDPNSYFLKAAKKNNIFFMEWALRCGAEINYFDPHAIPPQTALMIAAKKGYVTTAQFLWEYKADFDLNIKPKGANAPLTYAVQNNRKDMIQFLLDHDAALPPQPDAATMLLELLTDADCARILINHPRLTNHFSTTYLINFYQELISNPEDREKAAVAQVIREKIGNTTEFQQLESDIQRWDKVMAMSPLPIESILKHSSQIVQNVTAERLACYIKIILNHEKVQWSAYSQKKESKPEVAILHQLQAQTDWVVLHAVVSAIRENNDAAKKQLIEPLLKDLQFRIQTLGSRSIPSTKTAGNFPTTKADNFRAISIKEKRLPEQDFQHLFSEPRVQNRNWKEKKDSSPPFVTRRLSKFFPVKPLMLQHQVTIDQAIHRQIVAQQAQNQKTYEKEALQDDRLSLYIDQSTPLTFAQAFGNIRENNTFRSKEKFHGGTAAFISYIHYVEWAQQLEEAVKTEYLRNDNCWVEVQFTELFARKITEKSAGTYLSSPNLNDLPAGSFYDEIKAEDGHKIILIQYNEDLAIETEKQAKEQKKIVFTANVESRTDLNSIIYSSFSEELLRAQSVMDEDPKIVQSITESICSNSGVNFKKWLQVTLVNSIRSGEKNPAKILQALQVIKNRKIDTRRYPSEPPQSMDFLSYLVSLEREGLPLNSPGAVDWIYRLAEFDNNQSQLFYNITSSLPYQEQEDRGWFPSIREEKINGKEISRKPRRTYLKEFGEAVIRFLDFMKEEKIELPTIGCRDFSGKWGLSLLKDALDILHHLKGNRDALSFQARFLNKIPQCSEKPGLAKAKIIGGYSFVHEEMFLHESWVYFDPGIPNTFFIQPQDLKKLKFKTFHQNDSKAQTQIFRVEMYRSLFLRYVAWNIPPEKLDRAFDYWRECTGQLPFERLPWPANDSDPKTNAVIQTLFDNCQKNWEQLKTNLLSISAQKLEAKVASFSSTRIGTLDDSDHLAPAYELNRLETILKQIEPQNETKQTSFLTKQLIELDGHRKQSFSLDSETLITRIKGKGNESKDKKQVVQSVSHVECLALLREAYRRYTRSTSNKNGKWLRLEQAIVILAALEQNSLFKVETSEGKTLILQLIALVQVLTQGEKVDVITHSEPYAIRDASLLKPFASLLGIKVATVNDSPEEIVAADIYYCDIANSILNKSIANSPDRPNQVLPGDRKATSSLVDEVDAILDIHVETTMQISGADQGPADANLTDFLIQLNSLVEQAELNLELNNAPQVRQFIHNGLKDHSYYQENCQTDIELDFWIRASIAAMNRKKDKDYIVITGGEKDKGYDVIRIVHFETTGRVDNISEWGEGVHLCVAAREYVARKLQHQDLFEIKNLERNPIKIPTLSTVIGEGNVASHLASYPSLSVFTGTPGEEVVQQTIRELCPQIQRTLFIPRAKRPLPEGEEGPQYPLYQSDPENPKRETILPSYKRSYPIFQKLCKDESEQTDILLEGVFNAQQEKASSLLFFDTIEKVNTFYQLLLSNGIDKSSIQILDDTHDGEQDALRPPESILLANTGKPGMITLSTAAGSRATDFEEVCHVFLTKPGLDRVLNQQKDRGGRNGKLSVIHEIFCEKDFQQNSSGFELKLEQNEIKTEVQTEVEQEASERELQKVEIFFDLEIKYHSPIPEPEERKIEDQPKPLITPNKDVLLWKANRQKQDLIRIQERKGLDQFKDQLQEDFKTYLNTKPLDGEGVKNAWGKFFSKISLHWGDSKALRKVAEAAFRTTSWKVLECEAFKNIDSYPFHTPWQLPCQ